MTRNLRRLNRSALGIALLVVSLQMPVGAHDVPDEVVIQTFLKPAGTQLKVLLRVPLLAVTDTNLPKDGPGYLAMAYLDPALREAANQIATGIIFLEHDDRLSQFETAAARISLPSDKSFDTFDGALSHLHGPKLPDSTQLYYNQGYLDLELNYPIHSETADFGIQMLFGKGVANRTVTFVNFVRGDGAVRAFRLVDQTGVVRVDPSRTQTVSVFLTTGFFTFVDSVDLLVFVIVLAIPFRRLGELAKVVTAFAAAGALALMVATSGFMPGGGWFPVLISMLVALSILYVAVENALGTTVRRRSVAALGFGLVHGLAYAVTLREALQFSGGHPIAALLAYTIGLDAAQILILSIAVPAFTLLCTQVAAERAATIVLSLFCGHAAWHWMADQFATLQLMDVPALDLALAAEAVRWLLILVIAGGGLWYLGGLLRPEKSRVESR